MQLQTASLSELIIQLVQQIEQLLSAHMRLARQELTEDGKQLAIQSVGIVIGGILALQGVIFLGLAGYKVISFLLPGWAAALVVALIYTGIGIASIYFYVHQLSKTNLSAERTLEETKETIAWLTQQR